MSYQNHAIHDCIQNDPVGKYLKDSNTISTTVLIHIDAIMCLVGV